MIARIKLLRFFKAVTMLFIIGLSAPLLNAGDKKYIEMEIDGETVGKWVEFRSIEEYNPDGKMVHKKIFLHDGSIWEAWHEYDRNGNTIYSKNPDGKEWWFEYDRNGNKIYSKEPDGTKYWYKYDRNGNLIYSKDSGGIEIQYEYDHNGKMICSKKSLGHEMRFEYDEHGNMTRHISKVPMLIALVGVTVYILEYYENSTTLKTLTGYSYEPEWKTR